jgi:hypothetical protein
MRKLNGNVLPDGSRDLGSGFRPPPDIPNKYSVTCGIDLHNNQLTVSIINNETGGAETREYPRAKKSMGALARWMIESGVERTCMESTGTLWRSPYDLLHNAGVRGVVVVNARSIKNPAPGKKTGKQDSLWPAKKAGTNEGQASRVLDRNWEDIRGISRERHSFLRMRNTFKNRVIKTLNLAGFNITRAVSDVFGKTGMIILPGLLAVKPVDEIVADTRADHGLQAQGEAGGPAGGPRGPAVGLPKVHNPPPAVGPRVHERHDGNPRPDAGGRPCRGGAGARDPTPDDHPPGRPRPPP